MQRELNPETCIYFDIETTGLKAETSHLYLIGYAVQKKPGSWEIRQLFAERTEDERDLLKAFSDICMRYRTVIHFNGDRFDIPYLETKYQEYSMPSPFRQMDTADIYRMVRPYKDRDGHSGDPKGDLEKLLLHNYEDVLGMLSLTMLTAYPAFFQMVKNSGKTSAKTSGKTTGKTSGKNSANTRGKNSEKNDSTEDRETWKKIGRPGRICRLQTCGAAAARWG